MDYAAAVRDTWRHHDLDAAGRDYVPLVRYATLAASSHNTQPWKFALEPGRIMILPDLSRRCPAVDPDDHHLFVSLGCAAENLVLAAQAAGLQSRVSYDASRSSIEVGFEEASPTPSPLFDAIPSRQCSRTAYDGTLLTSDQLRLLEKAGRGDGVSVMLLTDSGQKEQLTEYVVEGNRAQFGDPRWAEELRSWIRFNGRDAVRSGDGLYGRAIGSPDVPGWMGRLFMRLGFSAERQNRKEIAYIRSSAAIAVIVSEIDDKPHWIEAGRCYERLALQATALELRSAFINQPVEVARLRQQFATLLGIGHRRPDLVIRIGRGPEMPRSLRRPVEHVLL
jgi:hypothetical protein